MAPRYNNCCIRIVQDSSGYDMLRIYIIGAIAEENREDLMGGSQPGIPSFPPERAHLPTTNLEDIDAPPTKHGIAGIRQAVPASSKDNVDLDALAHHREQILGAQLLSLLLEQAELVHRLRQRRAAQHLLLDRGELLIHLDADRGADVILRDGLWNDEDRDARFVELRGYHAIHAGGEQDGEYREDDQPLPAEEKLAVFPQFHFRSKGHPYSLISPWRCGRIMMGRTEFRAGYRP